MKILKLLPFLLVVGLAGCDENATQSETRFALIKKYDTVDVTEVKMPRGTEHRVEYLFLIRTKDNVVLEVYASGNKIYEEHYMFGSRQYQ